jgi:hypothetical protein
VRSLVGPGRARLLDQLIAAYPDAIAKPELAELAGVSASSSGYTNNLGSLRSLGLIDYPPRATSPRSRSSSSTSRIGLP